MNNIPHELSPWSMFMSADIVVKAVMLALAFASLLTWTIFIAKTIQMILSGRHMRTALTRLNGTKTLAEAQLAVAHDTLPASFVAAAIREIKLSEGAAAGIQERAASRFAEIVRTEGRSARSGLGFVAMVASTAPFVGLFGTVWGIMNSFIGISKSQTTNLAVVAPGIAEALLATAIGLVAAIPAVLVYNHLVKVTKGYLDQVNRASGAVARLLSRDLDRNRHGAFVRSQAE